VGAWVGGLLATKEWAKVWVFRLLVGLVLVEIGQLLHRFGVLRF
jgi:ABC-type enterobactin transport system permease subunit